MSSFLAFNLDFYTEVLDLNYLLDHIKDDPFSQKYKKLNEALVGLVEDYGLVSFRTLDVQVSGVQTSEFNPNNLYFLCQSGFYFVIVFHL